MWLDDASIKDDLSTFGEMGINQLENTIKDVFNLIENSSQLGDNLK